MGSILKDTGTVGGADYDSDVVVVGGGPIGLLTAYALSHLSVPCIIAEQSLTTTKWPKMDLTNCRTMEILRMWGIADEYRAQEGSVPQEANLDSIFVDRGGPDGTLIHSFVSAAALC